MADYKTGDILIDWKGPGHAALVYQGNADGGLFGGGETKIIHAQSGSNFHINKYNKPWGNTYQFRPIQPLSEELVLELRKIALVIKEKAEYGIGRMLTRLPFTASKWDKHAERRYTKYSDRLDAYFKEGSTNTKASMKVVSKVTCAEAVILCYQLTLKDPFDPLFPKLNARGTGPGNLKRYLDKSDAWGLVEKT